MRALSGWGAGLLAVAMLVCGCGQGSSAATRSAIRLESPAVGADGVIAPGVRCGGGTIWFPLKWGALPDGTRELVLYFGWFKNEVKGGKRKVVAPFGAVIHKIKPSLHGIAANTLPLESEWSYFTLDNCQPARKGQHYLVELFALDHPQRAVPETLSRGLVTGLTEEALGVGRFAGDSESTTRLTAEALAVGRLTATYGPEPK